MALLDSIKGTVKDTVNNAVDTISTVTNTIIEKNRTNAQLNRLRLVMKNESEMMNRAYNALGKHYYESVKNGEEIKPALNEKELFEVIETSKARIKKARERYSLILENQTVEICEKYEIGEVEDITLACSNEDQYEVSPFKTEESDEATEATDANDSIEVQPTAEEAEESFTF